MNIYKKLFNIQQELLDRNDLELVERNGGNISDGN